MFYIFVIVTILSFLMISRENTQRSTVFALLFLDWSILCLAVFIWAVFYGNWHWSNEELIRYEPVMGRVVIFLSQSIWIIWLLLPCIVAGILMLYRKLSKGNQIDAPHSELAVNDKETGTETVHEENEEPSTIP